MKKLALSLFLLLAHPVWGSSFHLSSQVYQKAPFLKHEGQGRWKNYLTMNLPYAPVQKLYKQVEAFEGGRLKNRGEAHITVITPVEFWNVLKPQGLTMQEIQKIALAQKIQESRFEVSCLGQGRAQVKGHTEKTYYVVVQSKNLLRIRTLVQELFLKKGGKASAFRPQKLLPSHNTWFH